MTNHITDSGSNDSERAGSATPKFTICEETLKLEEAEHYREGEIDKCVINLPATLVKIGYHNKYTSGVYWRRQNYKEAQSHQSLQLFFMEITGQWNLPAQDKIDLALRLIEGETKELLLAVQQMRHQRGIIKAEADSPNFVKDEEWARLKLVLDGLIDVEVTGNSLWNAIAISSDAAYRDVMANNFRKVEMKVATLPSAAGSSELGKEEIEVKEREEIAEEVKEEVTFTCNKNKKTNKILKPAGFIGMDWEKYRPYYLWPIPIVTKQAIDNQINQLNGD